MLYTSNGDSGFSGLYGTKERFPKGSPIYDALGTLDELNTFLGICRAKSLSLGEKAGVKKKIDIPVEVLKIQQCLFVIQAELAGAGKTIVKTQIEELESTINLIEKKVGNPRSFIVPGTTELSGLFDFARATARRAEREVIKIRAREISPESMAYLNRLSSFLYAVARYVARAASGKAVEEVRPTY